MSYFDLKTNFGGFCFFGFLVQTLRYLWHLHTLLQNQSSGGFFLSALSRRQCRQCITQPVDIRPKRTQAATAIDIMAPRCSSNGYSSPTMLQINTLDLRLDSSKRSSCNGTACVYCTMMSLPRVAHTRSFDQKSRDYYRSVERIKCRPVSDLTDSEPNFGYFGPILNTLTRGENRIPNKSYSNIRLSIFFFFLTLFDQKKKMFFFLLTLVNKHAYLLYNSHSYNYCYYFFFFLNICDIQKVSWKKQIFLKHTKRQCIILV